MIRFALPRRMEAFFAAESSSTSFHLLPLRTWRSWIPPVGTNRTTSLPFLRLSARSGDSGFATRFSAFLSKALSRNRPALSSGTLRPKRPITVAATSTFSACFGFWAVSSKSGAVFPATVRWRTRSPPPITAKKLSRVLFEPWWPCARLPVPVELAKRLPDFAATKMSPLRSPSTCHSGRARAIVFLVPPSCGVRLAVERVRDRRVRGQRLAHRLQQAKRSLLSRSAR